MAAAIQLHRAAADAHAAGNRRPRSRVQFEDSALHRSQSSVGIGVAQNHRSRRGLCQSNAAAQAGGNRAGAHVKSRCARQGSATGDRTACQRQASHRVAVALESQHAACQRYALIGCNLAAPIQLQRAATNAHTARDRRTRRRVQFKNAALHGSQTRIGIRVSQNHRSRRGLGQPNAAAETGGDRARLHRKIRRARQCAAAGDRTAREGQPRHGIAVGLKGQNAACQRYALVGGNLIAPIQQHRAAGDAQAAGDRGTYGRVQFEDASLHRSQTRVGVGPRQENRSRRCLLQPGRAAQVVSDRAGLEQIIRGCEEQSGAVDRTGDKNQLTDGVVVGAQCQNSAVDGDD